VVSLPAAKWVSTTIEGGDYDTAMSTAFQVKVLTNVLFKLFLTIMRKTDVCFVPGLAQRLFNYISTNNIEVRSSRMKFNLFATMLVCSWIAFIFLLVCLC
jgi:hypothetical protein